MRGTHVQNILCLSVFSWEFIWKMFYLIRLFPSKQAIVYKKLVLRGYYTIIVKYGGKMLKSLHNTSMSHLTTKKLWKQINTYLNFQVFLQSSNRCSEKSIGALFHMAQFMLRLSTTHFGHTTKTSSRPALHKSTSLESRCRFAGKNNTFRANAPLRECSNRLLAWNILKSRRNEWRELFVLKSNKYIAIKRGDNILHTFFRSRLQTFS